MIFDRRNQSAFTLAELIVAAAISIVIVLLLGTMFGSLINTTSHANQRTDAFRDARAALQMMARDLSSLVKAQPAAYFEIAGDLAGPDVRQIHALVAVKNKPAGAGTVGGDLCAVRYYCGWDSTKRAYSLRRYFADSDPTLKAFKANLKSDGTLNYTASDKLYSQATPPATDEPIATYAWNLQVVAYDSSGNVINRTSDVNGHDTTGPYLCDPATSSNPLPASIEVSFKAISSAAARTVIGATSGRANAYDVWKVVDNAAPLQTDRDIYNRMIAPNAYDFRTRIYLK
jgi:type II secretory pathway pseudopilin PulG